MQVMKAFVIQKQNLLKGKESRIHEKSWEHFNIICNIKKICKKCAYQMAEDVICTAKYSRPHYLAREPQKKNARSK